MAARRGPSRPPPGRFPRSVRDRAGPAEAAASSEGRGPAGAGPALPGPHLRWARPLRGAPRTRAPAGQRPGSPAGGAAGARLRAAPGLSPAWRAHGSRALAGAAAAGHRCPPAAGSALPALWLRLGLRAGSAGGGGSEGRRAGGGAGGGARPPRGRGARGAEPFLGPGAPGASARPSGLFLRHGARRGRARLTGEGTGGTEPPREGRCRPRRPPCPRAAFPSSPSVRIQTQVGRAAGPSPPRATVFPPLNWAGNASRAAAEGRG